MTDQPSPLRRAMIFLGLAVEPGAELGTSRYGAGASVSHRLDEDLDDLRARVEELERRLGD